MARPPSQQSRNGTEPTTQLEIPGYACTPHVPLPLHRETRRGSARCATRVSSRAKSETPPAVARDRSSIHAAARRRCRACPSRSRPASGARRTFHSMFLFTGTRIGGTSAPISIRASRVGTVPVRLMTPRLRSVATSNSCGAERREGPAWKGQTADRTLKQALCSQCVPPSRRSDGSLNRRVRRTALMRSRARRPNPRPCPPAAAPAGSRRLRVVRGGARQVRRARRAIAQRAPQGSRRRRRVNSARRPNPSPCPPAAALAGSRRLRVVRGGARQVRRARRAIAQRAPQGSRRRRRVNSTFASSPPTVTSISDTIPKDRTSADHCESRERRQALVISSEQDPSTRSAR